MPSFVRPTRRARQSFRWVTRGPCRISVEHGKFGFVEMNNQRKDGTTKLVCQLTIRAGKVVYDLNGISSDLWNSQPTSDYELARYWTTMMTRDENKKDKPVSPAEVH